MRVVLFLLSLVTGFFGFVLLMIAKTALHEIQAFILFLIAAVLLSGAGVVDVLVGIRKWLAQTHEENLSCVERKTPEALPAKEEKLEDAQLMEKFGITFDGEKYRYQEYRYENLRDAVNYAMRSQ